MPGKCWRYMRRRMRRAVCLSTSIDGDPYSCETSFCCMKLVESSVDAKLPLYCFKKVIIPWLALSVLLRSVWTEYSGEAAWRLEYPRFG